VTRAAQPQRPRADAPPRAQSLAGKSKHQLWLELCDVITKHPAEVTSLPVGAILRGGVRKFTDEVGRLWTSLADFYIRRGLFEKARDVYEEGLATVITVRDFSLVFDAFTQFEESMLSAKMEAAVDAPEPDGDDAGGEGDDFVLRDSGDDMDLRLARLEHLMERRPELLSSVMLRQNPHNVHEWMKRVAIFEGKPERQILTFTEAVKTVLPDRAVGRPHTIWVAFARFYEEHGDVVNARVIFDKATAVAYKTVEELASVWCEWAEMELRAKNFPGALELMRRATAAPARVRGASLEDGPVQARVHRSLKLWSFYCDLEESLGTLEGSRRVYDSMLDLRVATPQTVLNYAALLQETKHWEDSFAVYERGVNAFKYPHVKDIWLAYLQEFVARYGGRKLERARDLYEQAVTAFPPDACKPLYMAYAKLEEEHGLARHAMDIYARCTASVPDNEKLAVYELYCARAMDAFGVPKVRSIYQTAIEAELPDGITLALCTRFAALERKLGEIDRARALYIHASQFANPASEAGFWEDWNAFEVKHGNEDTFREMLRIKRSVSAAFSQTHFNMSVVELAARAGGEAPPVEAAGPAGGDPMAALDAQVASAGLRGFVSAGITGGTASAAANDEEISLGDDDEGEAMEAPEPDIRIEQQVVPEAVFGDVAAAAAAGKAIAADAAGAGARFAKRQKTV
jgi:pre-mRNA-splicing factor SYF1